MATSLGGNWRRARSPRHIEGWVGGEFATCCEQTSLNLHKATGATTCLHDTYKGSAGICASPQVPWGCKT